MSEVNEFGSTFTEPEYFVKVTVKRVRLRTVGKDEQGNKVIDEVPKRNWFGDEISLKDFKKLLESV